MDGSAGLRVLRLLHLLVRSGGGQAARSSSLCQPQGGGRGREVQPGSNVRPPQCLRPCREEGEGQQCHTQQAQCVADPSRFPHCCPRRTHRIMHTNNLGWSMHVMHHSSMDYNFTVGLRGGIFDITFVS